MELNTVGFKFRSYLRDELNRRIQLNTSYSLRAFAKNLNISASSLSMILNGKTPVSLKFIEKIGHQLNLKEEKIYEYQIELLKEKNGFQLEKKFEFIEEDRFKLVKDWYHYAVLNLMRVKGFKQSANWIAKRLKINVSEAQIAVENLQKANLIEVKDQIWVDTSNLYTSHTNNKKVNNYAKENQQQLFTKAFESIEEVEFQYRNHTGASIALDINDIEDAKKFITKFRKQFIKKFDKKNNADEVYHLSVALFPLSHKK